MKQLVTLLLLFLTYFSSYGQVDVYQPKTLMLKLKPASKNARISFSPLGGIFEELEVSSYSRAFAFSNGENNPNRKRNTVDLTSIFELHYQADVDLYEAIALLQRTGMFEAVEPKYYFYPMYQPNDTLSDSTAPGGGGTQRQNQLEKHRLYAAWDVSKGDSSTVIGIVDTGTMLDHVDLKGTIAYNQNDTIDGINNDGDMFGDSSLVDNYHGWDLADWDNDPTMGTDGHGVEVAGCASGECDNQWGVCGTGFYCRHLFLKAQWDSLPNTISHGYEGLIYAAEHGTQVINLSWGVGGDQYYSSILQDVINYAAVDFDATVVASAGNASMVEENYYPASYANVLSVAQIRFNELLVGNFGIFVDINVLGKNVLTTKFADTTDWGPASGSSYAAPICAGVAGLIRSHRPGLTGLQTAELLRVTGIQNDNTPGNEPAVDKMGLRMDAYFALTDTVTPSVRIIDYQVESDSGHFILSGDTMALVLDFKNYLAPTQALSAVITAESGNFTVLQDSIFLGSIATLDTVTNYKFPFIIETNPLNTNDSLLVRIDFSDSNYIDHQWFYVIALNSNADSLSSYACYIDTKFEACAGNIDLSGDTLNMKIDFRNSIVSFDSGTVSIVSSSPNFNILNGNSWVSGAGYLDTFSTTKPFRIELLSSGLGDTLFFDIEIQTNTFTDTVSGYKVLSTTNADTLNHELMLKQHFYQTSSGSLTLGGDTVNLIAWVQNINCDIDSFDIELMEVSGNVSLIDSTHQFGFVSKLDSVINDSFPLIFYLEPGASVGDSIWFALKTSTAGWMRVDSILFVVHDSLVDVITGTDPGSLIINSFPNPFSDQLDLQLRSQSDADFTISLLDIASRELISVRTRDTEVRLNTDNLTEGVYMLLVTQGDKVSTYKLLKTK